MSAAAAAAAAASAAPAATPAAAMVESGLLHEVRQFFGLHHMLSVDEHSIRNWKYVQDETPLSNVWGVALCVALYFGLIHAMRWWVKQRGKPFDLNWYVIFHNSLMSIGSAVLWFALVAELHTARSASSMWALLCDPTGLHISGPLYFIYFVNYIFKYVELIDTFLLALRGKPIPFLHSYHHAATLVLCWSQLRAESCIQWLPIVINLLVHVIMYAYYTLHAMGIDVWWKKYLTMFQIVQFIVALTGCVTLFGARVLSKDLGLLDPAVFQCWGTHGGAYIGIAIIASYLLLFMQLYSQKYTKSGKPARVRPAASVDVDMEAINQANARKQH